MVDREVVISYSRADSAYVEWLTSRLARAGIAIWYDRLIHPGDPWSPEIEARIHASLLMVIVLSRASAESEHVRREIAFAEQHGKRLLPVLIEDATVPMALIALQRVDARNGRDPLPEIVACVARESGSPARIVPPPPTPTWEQSQGRARGRLLSVLALLLALVPPSIGYLRAPRFPARGELTQFLNDTCWVWYDPSELTFDEHGAARWPESGSLERDLDAIRQAGYSGIVTTTARGTMHLVPDLARRRGLATILGVFDPMDRAEVRRAIRCSASVDGYCVGRSAVGKRYLRENLAAACELIRARTGRPTTVCEQASHYDDAMVRAGDWLMPDAHLSLQDERTGAFQVDLAADVPALLKVSRRVLELAAEEDHPVTLVVPYPHAGIPSASRELQGAFYAALIAALRDPANQLRRPPSLIAQSAFDAPWKRGGPFRPWDAATGVIARSGNADHERSLATIALTAGRNTNRDR